MDRDFIDEARSAGTVRTLDQHEGRISALEKTGALITEIHTALIGTLDKPGLVREIKDHSEFIAGCKARHQEQKKARIDWARWAERGIIAAALGWIVTRLKVGIVP